MGIGRTIRRKAEWGWAEEWEVSLNGENIDVLISKRSNMKTIKGNEQFAISEDGQVYSFEKARLLRPQIDKIYNRISVRLGEKVHQIPRLVLETWKEPCPSVHHEPFHIDRNKYNNHFSNLRWATHSEIMLWGRENRKKDEDFMSTMPPPAIPVKANWIQISAERRRHKKLYFKSIGHAAQYLKLGHLEVTRALNEKTEYKGWRFEKI